MNPEITTAAAVATIIQSIKGWEIPSLIAAVMLAPWGVLLLVSYHQHRRFEQVLRMYENNFQMVEQVTALADGFKKMGKEYRQTLICPPPSRSPRPRKSRKWRESSGKVNGAKLRHDFPRHKKRSVLGFDEWREDTMSARTNFLHLSKQ